MGRGHLIRIAPVAAALAAVLATAAAAAGISWSIVTIGGTGATTRHAPVGYVAVDAAEERPWLGRLRVADRAVVRKLDLRTHAVLALFMDGRACWSNLGVSRIARNGRALAVTVLLTPPPSALTACAPSSTPYAVVELPRASLGRSLPTTVEVTTRARG